MNRAAVHDQAQTLTGGRAARHKAVIGLGFGDEGKGSIVDYLTRKNAERDLKTTVVRFNGGGQAAHNVVAMGRDGKVIHHTFSQFGSGTLAGAWTHLSKHMLVDPVTLKNEADHLRLYCGITHPYRRLTVDPKALVVTRYHKAANRLREALRRAKHGTCGMGIGETAKFALDFPDIAIRVEHLFNRDELSRLVTYTKDRLKSTFTQIDLNDCLLFGSGALQDEVRLMTRSFEAVVIEELIASSKELNWPLRDDAILLDIKRSPNHAIIFEGAQGVLLDEDYGFHPHTTWSKTTFANVVDLVETAKIPHDHVERIGVMRIHHTRHGAGPLPTHNDGLDRSLFEPHNGSVGAQGAFRVGHFDAVLGRYALNACGGVRRIALTHIDRCTGSGTRICTAYQYPLRDSGLPLRLKALKLPRSLDEQEHLTGLLDAVRPYYHIGYGAVTAPRVRREIERVLDTEVGIASYGPTAADKIEIEPG